MRASSIGGMSRPSAFAVFMLISTYADAHFAEKASSLMSVAVDFGITQVVDGNWCVHAVLRKSLFET